MESKATPCLVPTLLYDKRYTVLTDNFLESKVGGLPPGLVDNLLLPSRRITAKYLLLC